MTDTTIRQAAASDAAAIARLLGQLGYPTEAGDVPERLDRIESRHQAAVFLAERSGRVVGLATVHLLSIVNRRRDVALLTALVVDAADRGTGVGRALVQAVEDFARRAGCERLSVTTQESRTDAHAFYKRVGLPHTGRRFGKMLTP